MGFTPETLDNKIHKLEVRLKKPGMTARARRSYLAAAPSATARRQIAAVTQTSQIPLPRSLNFCGA